MVADASGPEVYLNAGQSSGLEIGQKLRCYRTGSAIKDPGSGLVIGYKEREIGKAKIIRWCGQGGGCAIARLADGGTAKAKDICRLDD